MIRDRIEARDRAIPVRFALRDVIGNEAVIVAGIALAIVAVHVIANARYGYQRDELYDLMCGRRLAFGYVDQPPLIALIARFTEDALGTSLEALRLLPSLAAAGLAVLGAFVARRFGGGRYAQALAMTAIALAPFDLAVGSLMTMNAFEPLFWTAAAMIGIVILRANSPPFGLWFALGAVIGVGLLNKYSMGFYALALCAGVLISDRRRILATRGFVLAALVAVVLVLPTLAWQAAHGWPQIELLRHAEVQKNAHVSAPVFALDQILMMNPFAAPLWIAGIVFFLRARETVAVRAIGWSYLSLLALYLALSAKVYYMAPVYAVFLGAGAVVFERLWNARPAWRGAYFAFVVLSGLVVAPQALPLLPLDGFLTYQRVFDVRGVKMERHPKGAVPQNFADMLGWETLVGTMDAAIPQEGREKAAILTGNYGQAAALEFLGASRGLPRVISGHTNYYIWGPRGASGSLVYTIGVPESTLRREWRHIERIATYENAYVLPDQNHLPIYRCTEPIRPLLAAWPLFQSYV